MGVNAQTFQFLLSQVRASGVVLSGGKVYFYAAGTQNLKTVWLDRGKTTEAANPYTLDANGTAQVFGDGLYDVVIKDASNVTKYEWENISVRDISGNVYDVADYASLSAAVTAIGSTPATLQYATDQTLVANLAIPANIELLPLNGAVINHGAYTVSYAGSTARWPDAKVFDGTGTVSGLTEVRVSWFGMKPDYDFASDTGTDCAPIWAKIMSTGAKTVRAKVGRYVFRSAIAKPGAVSFEGENRSDSATNGVIFYATNGTGNTFFTINNDGGISGASYIRNLKLVDRDGSYGKGLEYTNGTSLGYSILTERVSVFAFDINLDIYNANSLKFVECVFNNPRGNANVIIGTGYRQEVNVYANAITFSKCSFDANAGSGDKYNVLIGTAGSTYALSNTYKGDLAGVTFTDSCEFTGEKDAVVVSYGTSAVINFINNYFESVVQDGIRIIGPSTCNMLGNFFASDVGDSVTYYPIAYRSDTTNFRGSAIGNLINSGKILLPTNYITGAVNYSGMFFAGNDNGGLPLFAGVVLDGGKSFTQWPVNPSDLHRLIGAKQVTTDTLTVVNRAIIGAPPNTTGFPTNSNFPNGSVTMYLDEAGNNIKFYVKKSDGTIKTGTLPML